MEKLDGKNAIKIRSKRNMTCHANLNVGKDSSQFNTTIKTQTITNKDDMNHVSENR